MRRVGISAAIVIGLIAGIAGPTNSLAQGDNRAPHAGARHTATKIVQHGKASYYADRFHGRKTASGVPMNQNAMTAASKELPLGTRARVTNLETGRTVIVKINDRGPYVPGRVIDLSKRAADALAIREQGVAPVKVEARAADQPTPTLREKVAEVARSQTPAPERQVATSESRETSFYR